MHPRSEYREANDSEWSRSETSLGAGIEVAAAGQYESGDDENESHSSGNVGVGAQAGVEIHNQ